MPAESAPPPISIGKTSFSTGEIAPSLRGRVDLAKYASAAALLRNFTVKPTGGAQNMAGTHYIAKSKTNGKKARVIPFQFSSTQSYVIEAGDTFLRFYKNGGQILSAGVAYEIVSPYAEVDLFNIRYAQSADILFCADGTHIQKMVERTADTNWSVVDFPFVGGPFMLPNTDNAFGLVPGATTGAGITLVSDKDLFDPLHVGALFRMDHFIEGQKSILSLGAGGAQASIACGGTWRLITHGTWAGEFSIEKSTDGGTTWTRIRAFSGNSDNNVNTFGTEFNPSGNQFLVRLNFTTYVSGTLKADLTTDSFTQRGIVKIATVVNSKNATADVQTTLGGTSKTFDWSEGSWSNFRGWPRAVCFNQNRLVFASTKTEPDTYWPSQSGNFYDFSMSNPLLATDSFSDLLPTRELNQISALVPLMGIVAFTSSAEFAIGDPNVTFEATNIITRANSYYGSSGVQPIVIGNRIIFVQASGDVIRDLAYQYFYQYFDGAKLSIFSEHLFFNHSIVEMAYQQDPDGIVWMVRDDGQLVALTYLKEQDVVGFTHCDTRDGNDTYESVCTIQGTGWKEVWFVVNRGGQRFIEQLDKRMNTTDPTKQFFVDCGIIYSGVPQTVITGLGHLEGKNVAVLADGFVVANYDKPFVVTGGSITLPAQASYAIVGIPKVADLQTLRIEIAGQEGTTQGKQLMISKLLMQVENSRGGYLGPNFNKLYEVKTTAPEKYGVPKALYTGDVKDQLSPAFQDGGRVCFRQKDPLPVTVLGFVPSITVGGVTTVPQVAS